MRLTEKERKFVEQFFSYKEVWTPYDEMSYQIDINWESISKIPEFGAMYTLRQNPKWHSESEFVIGHVENVIKECKNWIECKMNIDEEQMVVLMLAAIFHDVGKATTTFFKEKDQQWHHYGHEVESEKITRRILWDLGCNIREKVCGLVRWHMEPFNLMKSKDAPVKMLELQHKVCSIELLHRLKMFDMKGSVPADPETCKFDEDILDEFANLATTLNCYYHPNEIANVRKRVQRILLDKRQKLDVYLYMGLPGAGKDTDIYQRIKSYNNITVVCRDDIRVELGYCGKNEKYLGTTEEENKVTELFNQKLIDAAKRGDTIIINNMNNRRKYRDDYKQKLKDYNVTWHYVYVEADSIQTNIDRRKGQIHRLAFMKMS